VPGSLSSSLCCWVSTLDFPPSLQITHTDEYLVFLGESAVGKVRPDIDLSWGG
jgi:hypothetical protein